MQIPTKEEAALIQLNSETKHRTSSSSVTEGSCKPSLFVELSSHIILIGGRQIITRHQIVDIALGCTTALFDPSKRCEHNSKKPVADI